MTKGTTNEEAQSSMGPHHRTTLRIKRLLATQLKVFHLELIGQDHPALVRVGALLVFGPFLVIGYAFALASVARYLAIWLGWSIALLLVGLVHLAVGVWGMKRSRAITFAQSYDLVVPECEPEKTGQAGRDRLAADRLAAFAFDNAVTQPSLFPRVESRRRVSREKFPRRVF